MTYNYPIEFRRNSVEAVACMKGGWTLIKDQYWLFVGMSLVGILLGGFVPFNILLGPMMCGIYLALFQRQRGVPVEFGNLFRGFDYFAQSLVATLLHMAPIMVMMIPFYAFIFLGPLLLVGERGDPSSGGVLFVTLLVIFGIIMAAMILVLTIAFLFAYPLIVDRRLSGVEAVKLSLKAGMGNFWRLLGLLLLNGLLGLAGVLLCYVGLFLALPVIFAAVSVAYTQVFGLGEVRSPLPPPPPMFS
jgi:hypothetical protein